MTFNTQQGNPVGLTGATAATRYVGATVSGAPASGTFAVGDFVTTSDGSIYVCTVAGTPGTWVQPPSSGGPPTGNAGGDLTGTYPNPTIGAGKVTQAKMAAMSGTIAARVAAASTASPIYMATDIAGGQPYFNTGASWVPAGPSNPVSLSTMTTFTGTGQAGGTDVTLWTPSTVPTAMWAVGTRLFIQLDMDFDIINSATARNFVFKVAIGATTLWSGTLVGPTTVALTNQSMSLIAGATCYATGAGGSVRSHGQVIGMPTGLGLAIKQMENASTGTNVLSVDLSAGRAITVTVNESVNSVADVVRAQAGHFMVLNPV